MILRVSAVTALVAFAFVSAAAPGQTGKPPAAPEPAFEVASLKPSGTTPSGPRGRGFIGGPGSADPERITGSFITLQGLLRQAYGVDFDQIQGPSWLAEERYELAAKVPPGTTKEQVPLMLQALLQERFKLTLHHIQKDFPVYELTIAKGGLKITENTETLEPAKLRDPQLPPDPDGYPQIAPGKSGMASNPVSGLNRMTARGMPLSMLLLQVRASVGTLTGPNTYAPGRIVDKTGLTGVYDFKLEFAGNMGIGSGLSLPTGSGGEPTGGLTLVEAMEKQLGLKLTKSTAPYDVLVIDHAEKVPTEN